MSALDGTPEQVDFHGGASFKGQRGTRLKPCSREIKMLRPICKPCEEAAGGVKYLEPGWFTSCEHDPYVSVREIKTTEPEYKDILVEKDVLGEDGEPTGEKEMAPTGEKEVTGTKTVSKWVSKPNWVSITHASGMNKGRGVDRALRRGFIYPQQLRSPAFPEGIKMRCMFRECYDERIKQYKNGWFCREVEAKLVKVSDSEETWEVGQFSVRSDKLQAQILDRMVV